MKQKSIWLENFKETKKKPKWKHLKTNILIIGGGIAGMSVAEELKQDKDVVLIDSGTIGFGVTAYTTAKITPLQEFVYHTIAREYGVESASLYYKSQEQALQKIKENVKKYKIDCHFKEVPSYTLATDQKGLEQLEQETSLFDELKIRYQTVTTLPIPITFQKGIGLPSAVFHPLLYLYGLKKEIEKTVSIYENVRAIKIEKQENFKIKTTQGMIEANTVIVCTHYPFFLTPGFIPFKNHIEKSYVIASPVSKPQKLSCITSGLPLHSIRYEENYILYGSGSHALTSKLNEVENYQKVEQRFHDVMDGEIAYQWSNQDLITNDSLPFIGEVMDHLYLATGFNTWGMTNGTISGNVIADLIHGVDSPYADLFSFHRKGNFIKFKNFILDGCRYSKIFLQTALIKNHNFYPENVKVVTEHGNKIGVYTDENGMEHKVYNKCPHMKCNLIFNAKEKTWDCPCHSSRFDLDGNVIKGPSTTSIKYHE